MLSSEESTRLFWTGGWDSTFQLLRLVLVHQHKVTPYYLIDAERPSTGLEIRAMQRIKKCLFSKYPSTEELLQPTRYYAVADITPDCSITEAFDTLRNRVPVGTQYEWLARFCKQHSLTPVQLCGNATLQPNHMAQLLDPVLSEVHKSPYPIYQVDPGHRRKDVYTLFWCYEFPLLDLTKQEMGTIAEEHGWQEIMHMTWFCHTPRGQSKPCGSCSPCRQVIEEGLEWRIPISSRIICSFEREFVWRVRAHWRGIVNRFSSVRFPAGSRRG